MQIGSLSVEQTSNLVQLGALRRIEEIGREIDGLKSAFPAMFDAPAHRGPGRKPALKKAIITTASATVRPAVRPAPKRGGWKMSAAQRRAVSKRMKKYWTARRKAKRAN